MNFKTMGKQSYDSMMSADFLNISMALSLSKNKVNQCDNKWNVRASDRNFFRNNDLSSQTELIEAKKIAQ